MKKLMTVDEWIEKQAKKHPDKSEDYFCIHAKAKFPLKEMYELKPEHLVFARMFSEDGWFILRRQMEKMNITKNSKGTGLADGFFEFWSFWQKENDLFFDIYDYVMRDEWQIFYDEEKDVYVKYKGEKRNGDLGELYEDLVDRFALFLEVSDLVKKKNKK